MMSCIETRNEFAALWRKTATGERRTELLAHLAGCAKCDRAFRVFALTAPVLHSDAEPSSVVAREHRNVAPGARGQIEIAPGARGQTEIAPVARDHRAFSAFDRPQRFASVARVERGPRRWLAMSSAAAIFMFASSAAYLSMRSSSDTLNDVLSKPEVSASFEAAADPFAAEMPSTESDLAS
jgi:hypothetical protein